LVAGLRAVASESSKAVPSPFGTPALRAHDLPPTP